MKRCKHPLEKLYFQEEVRKGRVDHTNDEAVNCYTGRVRVLCRECRLDKIYSKWSRLPERFRTILGHLTDRSSGDVWDI